MTDKQWQRKGDLIALARLIFWVGLHTLIFWSI